MASTAEEARGLQPAGRQPGGQQPGGRPTGGRPTGRANRSPLSATVRRTEWLSPTMVRIVIGGPGLADFAANEFTDAYVKLLFLRPGVDYPRPLDLAAVREQFDPQDWPQQRTYTVRAWDAAVLELTIDFVVHGDEGIAGPWAATARPGDELLLNGPGGGYTPDQDAAWHLLVGDESALPAIAAAAERLPAGAIGHLVVELDHAGQEQKLTVPSEVQVRWVHRGDRPLGAALLEAVAGLSFPAGVPQAFVHGEAGLVRDLRRLLRIERGIAPSQLSISGYWRHGATDEGWRAMKRDWNQAIEQSESNQAESNQAESKAVAG